MLQDSTAMTSNRAQFIPDWVSSLLCIVILSLQSSLVKTVSHGTERREECGERCENWSP